MASLLLCHGSHFAPLFKISLECLRYCLYFSLRIVPHLVGLAVDDSTIMFVERFRMMTFYRMLRGFFISKALYHA